MGRSADRRRPVKGRYCRRPPRQRQSRCRAYTGGPRFPPPKSQLMPIPSLTPAVTTPQRRELYFFNLFRLLEAGILALVAFTPL